MNWRDAAQRLDAFVRDELGCKGDIALHEPWLDGNEWNYVKDCLDSGWVSSVGKYVDRFEAEMAKVCGTRYGVAAVNGTAALHLALTGLGVIRDDLVICPALSFIGTANAISYCGAEPLFMDIDATTLGLDAAALMEFLETACEAGENGAIHRESGRRIAACVPVHVFGHPADMDPIVAACRKYGIAVLEDAAESLGSRYKGRACGALGRAGALSFNGNKVLTTGGGGMVVTDDEELAKRLKHLSTTAKVPHAWHYHHDAVGFNYRLPNINAALGCAQLESLDARLELKRRLHARLTEVFQPFNGVTLFEPREWAECNHWLNAIFLPDRDSRDAFLADTTARGLHTRPCWDLLADLPIYAEAPRASDLSAARDIVARAVTLPSSPQLMAGTAAHE